MRSRPAMGCGAAQRRGRRRRPRVQPAAAGPPRRRPRRPVRLRPWPAARRYPLRLADDPHRRQHGDLDAFVHQDLAQHALGRATSTSSTALSDSTCKEHVAALIVSPSFFSHSTMVPSSIVWPSLGRKYFGCHVLLSIVVCLRRASAGARSGRADGNSLTRLAQHLAHAVDDPATLGISASSSVSAIGTGTSSAVTRTIGASR